MSMTEFSNPTGINWQGDVGVVEYGGGDRGMVCLFYNRPIHNPAKSNEAGRQIFEDMVYVRIHPPGERFNIIDRPMQQQDARRWPTQWAQFRQNQTQMPEGTPIEQLYPAYPSVAATMRAYGVSTIEQCADLSGPGIETIGMGCQRYVNDAKKYLESSNKGVKASQLIKELEERDRQIRVLTQNVADLTAQLQMVIDERSRSPDLQQIQSMLAGVMQRPVHVPNPNFDAASAQINANSAGVQTKPLPSATRRSRPRLG